MSSSIFFVLLGLPYRPSSLSELIIESVFAIVGLLFFLYIYLNINFGEKSQVAPLKLVKAIADTPSQSVNATTSATRPAVAPKAFSDDDKMDGFFAKLDKGLYNSILYSDFENIEGLYKQSQRTTKWQVKFFRYLDQRKFKDGLFYDSRYITFNYGLWQITVLFHNKKAVRCAVIGVNWHYKPFLDRVLPIKEWTESDTGRNWSFAMSEHQFWLTAEV